MRSMVEGYWLGLRDPYCYQRTGVLRNKAGLRDAEALEAFELEMTTLRSEEPLPHGCLAAGV